MKLAINRNAINKIPAGDPRHGLITRSYKNVDVDQEAFAGAINEGFAFCAQHKNGRRASKNFTCAGFTAADIDHGLCLEEALEHEFVKQYASVVYTTPSHTKENHRFRIIFETERDITDPKEMRNAYNGVIKKLGGDPSCKDPCRQFWGSKGSNPQVLGNILPNSALDELILLGQETLRQHDYKGDDTRSVRSTVRSNRTLEIGVEVYDANGNLHRLADLPPSTPVRCPVHADRNPSAVTLRSKGGTPGVYCSSCATTYFESDDVPIPTYDFDYGLKRLFDIEVDAYDEIEADPPYLLHKEGEIVGERRDVSRIRERYLPPPDEHAPVVFVKSPKGSGKTQWLESVVKRCKKNGESVLLIGHRQSLIQALADRLKLHPYIMLFHSSEKGEDKTAIHPEAPRDHYAICVDSLHVRLNPEVHKYDVVLVDEVEQVFSHLTSATVRDRRLEAYEWFRHYFDAASRVYLLDADLNRLTVETLADFLKTKTRDVQVVINEHHERDRKVALYESKPHLETDLIRCIQSGKRCFVCSNSKSYVDGLAETIKEDFGDTKKALAITSENSKNGDIQQFLKMIKTAILDYDVVLVSPSVGTGVDITFPDDAALIDCVYGFFEARVNTHFDIDQQLSRVRNPKEMKVWISPERFFFETHPDVVKREVESADSNVPIFLGLEPDGKRRYNQNEGYLNLYANVVAMRRGSKNDLRRNFVTMKKHYGCEIVEVAMDELAAQEGKETMALRKEKLEQRRIQELLAATLITKDECKTLWGRKSKKVTNLGADEKIAMERYWIESFYLTAISEDLIEADNKGKLRTQVRNYERFTSPDASLFEDDEWEVSKGLHTTDRRHHAKQKEVLTELFRSAGIINDAGSFLTDVIITTDTLGDFVTNCGKRKDEIVTLFNKPVRLDIGKKPIQQLTDLLRMLGISRKRTTRKVDGNKIYEYRVCEDSIKKIQAIADARSSEAKEQWQHERDETFENRLFNEDNKLKVPRTFGMSLPGLPPGRAFEWTEVESLFSRDEGEQMLLKVCSEGILACSKDSS